MDSIPEKPLERGEVGIAINLPLDFPQLSNGDETTVIEGLAIRTTFGVHSNEHIISEVYIVQTKCPWTHPVTGVVYHVCAVGRDQLKRRPPDQDYQSDRTVIDWKSMRGIWQPKELTSES